MRGLWGLALWSCSLNPKAPDRIGLISIYGSTLPILSMDCLARYERWALALHLGRDALKGVPEWVSGHRYALAFYLEQLQPHLLLIEAPEAVEPRLSADQLSAWVEALKSWLAEELLPFLRPYPIEAIAFGLSWRHVPFPKSFWLSLLASLRQEGKEYQWGIGSDVLADSELWPHWDFFVAPCTGPTLADWTALGKPLWLLCPPSGKPTSLPPNLMGILESFSCAE
ncbi:MAG: hypothetical protein NZ958_04090 [Bacteroidia bacterium]|nr:hypothetical protein [Bacteroidia bacterium]MDW8088398.1 hypothetical protein [Bacteroidia bacterium]